MRALRFFCVLLVLPCTWAGTRSDGAFNDASNISSQGEKWGKQWCKQNDVGGCIVSDRSSLPSLDAGGQWDVSYVRKLFPPDEQILDDGVKAYHSGIFVQSAIDSSQRFIIEYIVLDFSANIFMPIPTVSGFKWDNSALVRWFPAWIASNDWGKFGKDWHFDSIYWLGRISGSTINSWLDEVPGWAAANTGYRLISMWSDADVTKAERYVNEATCQEFSEFSLISMFNHGAKFENQYPLCRNYDAVIVDKDSYQPVIIDITDPSTHLEAIGWYTLLTGCFGTFAFKRYKCQNLVDAIPYPLQAYVTDSNTNYWKGALKKPSFTGFVGPKYMSQRMLVPWQNWAQDAKVGECEQPWMTIPLSDRDNILHI